MVADAPVEPGVGLAMQRRALSLALLVALACGALTRLASLDAGLRTDDYVRDAMLDGSFPVHRTAYDLYWFSGRDAAETRALLDAGYLPWWTAPGYRLAMLRPLSSLAFWLEHHAGLDAFGQHVVSLLWLTLAIGAAGLLLSRLLPARAAAIALIVFALDGAHTVPLAWIANRHALTSSALATLALWGQVRARREGWRRGDAVTLIALTLALASGEYGVAVLGYMFAFELWAPGVNRSGGARRLGLLAGVAGAYLALHVAGGYGARHSGLYLSPLSDPLGYCVAAMARVPALVADLVVGLPTRYWITGHPWRDALIATGWVEPATWVALPSWRAWHVTIGLGTAGLVAWALRRRWLGDEAPWLAAGTLLSLAPMAVSLPDERLLGLAAVGASALIGLALTAAYDALRVPSPGRRRIAHAALAIAACACLVIHLPLAAWRAHYDTRAWAGRAAAARRWALAAPIPQDADVILVAASDFSTEAHVPWIRHAHGRPTPRSYRRLGGAQPYDVVRIDDTTLELSALTSNLEGTTAGSLYRAADEPIRPGPARTLAGMHVQVLRTIGAEPQRVRYHFDRPLEDAGLWLVVTQRGLERLTLPPPGQSLRLPRPPAP